jgi:hypothetical protein
VGKNAGKLIFENFWKGNKMNFLKNLFGTKEENLNENQINVIKPYKWNGMWVFDDDEKGLVKEPFVSGADTLIDVAVSKLNIKNADEGFLIIFSKDVFPDAKICLEWVKKEGTGDVYHWPEVGLSGWLCPALRKFFLEAAPKKIYINLKDVN